jgi:23S rRNA (adenine2503-C2)-methyltransferase
METPAETTFTTRVGIPARMNPVTTASADLCLVDCDLPTLEAELTAAGHKPVHAGRVLREFYESSGRPDFTAVSISHGVLHHIQQRFKPRRARILTEQVAADGTTKLLLALDAGGSVESVLMPAPRPGIAAGCVSSQIGCAMGCDFCASTRLGLERNLESGEIVEQFLHLKERATKIGRRLKTLVFMGMGEPLLNYDAVVAAIRKIADPRLGGLGWRQITVSTVGIVPGIDRLIAENLNVHLAVSLHAPDDATRSRLVPMNRRYNVADIMAAARRFEVKRPSPPSCRSDGKFPRSRQPDPLQLHRPRPHRKIVYATITRANAGISRYPPLSGRHRPFPHPARRRHHRRLRPASPDNFTAVNDFLTARRVTGYAKSLIPA